MYKLSLVKVVLLLSIFSTCVSVWAQNDIISLSEAEQNWLRQNNTVRVRAATWPPYQFHKGGVKGISIDYLEHVFNRHGIHFQYVTDDEVTWGEALKGIESHEAIDLLAIAKKTPEREKVMAFTEDYLFPSYVIFTKTDSPFIGGIVDLRGKTVAVQDNYFTHKIIEEQYPDIQLHVVSGENMSERCIKAVATGAADAFVGNLAVGTYIIQKNELSNVKVAASTPFIDQNLAMAVRNDWLELSSIINKTLAAMTPAEHAEIRNKWLSVRYEHGIRIFDVIKWVLGVASVLIAILIVSLFWNHKLKKEITARQKVEENLQESEARFRFLFNNTSDSVVILDSDLNYIFANPAANTYLGVTNGTIAGMNIREVMVSFPEFRDVWIQRLKHFFHTGEPRWTEDNIDIGGEAAWSESSLTDIRDADGLIVAVGIIYRDISERKQIEAEREDLIVNLETALNNVKTLHGLLPICSSCKKIRDDKGYWNQIEGYIQKHSNAEFSHSICPKCARKLYPDFDIHNNDSNQQ